MRVGFVGWRGMVGSVLMERMIAEGDFKGFEPLFFSTSQAGEKGPDIGVDIPLLMDANDLNLLSNMDIIVTCQGGSYTQSVYGELRKKGGQVTGLMRLQPLEWRKTALLFLIL